MRKRLFGLVLIGLGFLVMYLLFAFWRSGFDTPVKMPLPSPMQPSMAFAFNPLVCAMPLISVGAVGLMLEGLRRMLNPSDT